MKNKKKEIRLLELRAVENEEMVIEGYAMVFGSVTDLGYYKEVVDRNAFNNCDMSDVCMKYNHNDSVLIMARTRNGSLKLTTDDHGLKIRGKLIDTQSNRDIYKCIEDGLLDKMSVSFIVKEEEIDYENNIRKILAFDKLFDVSVVDVPAYDATEIFARSKAQYETEKDKYIKNKLAFRKAKMLLEMRL